MSQVIDTTEGKGEPNEHNPMSIRDWLAGLGKGYHEYVNAFESQGATVIDDLMDLDDDDIDDFVDNDLKISKKIHNKKLKKEIKKAKQGLHNIGGNVVIIKENDQKCLNELNNIKSNILKVLTDMITYRDDVKDKSSKCQNDIKIYFDKLRKIINDTEKDYVKQTKTIEVSVLNKLNDYEQNLNLFKNDINLNVKKIGKYMLNGDSDSIRNIHDETKKHDGNLKLQNCKITIENQVEIKFHITKELSGNVGLIYIST